MVLYISLDKAGKIHDFNFQQHVKELPISDLKGKDYFYNYGETRVGNAQLPSNHNLYDIGSITKTVTATLLAMAVNEGRFKLSSPISSFLPDSVSKNPALKGITLLQLSNHNIDHRRSFISPEASQSDF